MKKLITFTAAISSAAAFTSCQPQNHAQANAGTGAIVGGIAGALIGGDVESAAIGAGVGGAGGYMLGNEKDKKQR